MKKNEEPIPLRSIVGIPAWLMWPCVALSAAAMLAGVALIVYGVGWAASGNALGGYVGGGFGCLVGGAGGLFGTLADWRRRRPAWVYLRLVRDDRVAPFYRVVFWPALALFALGLVAALIWNHRAIWHGAVQTGGILAFISGAIEASRRHSVARGRAVFALYADGALDAHDTAAIDDARAKDPEFAADLAAHLAVSRRVESLVAGDGAGFDE